jgi:hypothetical protein
MSHESLTGRDVLGGADEVSGRREQASCERIVLPRSPQTPGLADDLVLGSLVTQFVVLRRQGDAPGVLDVSCRPVLSYVKDGVATLRVGGARLVAAGVVPRCPLGAVAAVQR